LEEEINNLCPEEEQDDFVVEPQLNTFDTRNGHRKSISITIQTMEPSLDEPSPLAREICQYENKLQRSSSLRKSSQTTTHTDIDKQESLNRPASQVNIKSRKLDELH